MDQGAVGGDIVGAWGLESFEVRPADGPPVHPFSEDAEGLLIYTASGRMSAQLMRLDPPTIAKGDRVTVNVVAHGRGYWIDVERKLRDRLPRARIGPFKHPTARGPRPRAYKGVVSYYGSYDLDEVGGFVVHRVQRSLFPGWEGQERKRFFKLEGDLLTLSTPPIDLDTSGEVVAVLQWRRIR